MAQGGKSTKPDPAGSSRFPGTRVRGPLFSPAPHLGGPHTLIRNMEAPLPDLSHLDDRQKLQLLERLLNDLSEAGRIPRSTLMTVAADVMDLEYREDEDLLCFHCLSHETEGE